ncbi:MAG: aminopeptidase P family protein [Sedimentisphaerales bacterium]|nr:aminopeptidase P family protein [Sedimentisphaerales bacterium]
MTKAEIISERAKKVREKTADKKANAILVTKVPNVSYLTGFLGDDSWALVTNKKTYLITDSRYTEQSAGECSGCKIIERKDSLAKAVNKLLGKSKSIKTLAVESTITAGALKALRKEISVKTKVISGIVETVRRTKDQAEIATIKKAARIANKALAITRKKIRTGMTENEVTGILELEMRKLGAKFGFETIIAFGPNGSRPHHQPTGRKLKKNDSVLIDFGAQIDGYTCDITRTFAVGKPGRLFEKMYKIVAESQQAAIDSIKAGVNLKDVDKAARDVMRKYGLTPYGHGTGHGLGMEVHEEPRLSEKAKGKLQAGDVITIEPGIYIPGKIGIRIEDDVLVTENGCKILSRS